MRCCVLILFLLLLQNGFAQIIVGGDKKTVIVGTSENRKSLPLAMGMSLLLPGTGEGYLGSSFRQKVSTSTDLVFWAVTGVSYLMQEHYFATAYAYAGRYAKADQAPRQKEFLETVERFRSRSGIEGQNVPPAEYDDYNAYQIRAGRAVDAVYPNTPEYSWDWGTAEDQKNSRRWNRFGDIMDNYRRSIVVFKASVGALILNRVVSMISVVQYYKSESSIVNIQAAPYIADDRPGVILIVGF